MNPTPKLAMFNSFAGFGRISLTAALPICAALNVQVCPAPTTVLSSHLAYQPCFLQDFTDMLPSYIKAWEDIHLTFDGVHVGYVRNATQLETICGFLHSKCVTPDTILVVDPVMGDYGKAYSTVTNEHILRMKEFVSLAHIITPNITEACLLTDSSMKEGGYSELELRVLCEKLDPQGNKKVVITGVGDGDNLINCIWEEGIFTLQSIPSAGNSRHGTGDIFSSIVAAEALHNASFTESVKKASDFISICMKDSDAEGIPIKEGILYEHNLHRLKNS